MLLVKVLSQRVSASQALPSVESNDATRTERACYPFPAAILHR